MDSINATLLEKNWIWFFLLSILVHGIVLFPMTPYKSPSSMLRSQPIQIRTTTMKPQELRSINPVQSIIPQQLNQYSKIEKRVEIQDSSVIESQEMKELEEAMITEEVTEVLETKDWVWEEPIETPPTLSNALVVNQVESKLSEYLSTLNLSKYYPKVARRRGMEDTVAIQLTVNSQGRVLEIQLKEPGMYAVLDRAGMKIIEEHEYELRGLIHNANWNPEDSNQTYEVIAYIGFELSP